MQLFHNDKHLCHQRNQAEGRNEKLQIRLWLLVYSGEELCGCGIFFQQQDLHSVQECSEHWGVCCCIYFNQKSMWATKSDEKLGTNSFAGRKRYAYQRTKTPKWEVAVSIGSRFPDNIPFQFKQQTKVRTVAIFLAGCSTFGCHLTHRKPCDLTTLASTPQIPVKSWEDCCLLCQWKSYCGQFVYERGYCGLLLHHENQHPNLSWTPASTGKNLQIGLMKRTSYRLVKSCSAAGENVPQAPPQAKTVQQITNCQVFNGNLKLYWAPNLIDSAFSGP